MLARLRFAWILGAAPALLMTTSCGFGGGDDYAVTVTWLINGTSPSEELCRLQGVGRVRFTARSSSKRRTLEADCDSTIVSAWDGLRYGGLRTTVSFDFGVPYDYEVQMLDAAGDPIPALGYRDTFEIHYADDLPLELAPLELWDPTRGPIASVFGSWTFDGAQPSATTCAPGDEVAIEVASSTDAAFEDYVEIAQAPCEDGEIDTRDAVLAEGEYVVRYVLFSADDEPLQEIPLADGDQLIPFEVKAPGELVIHHVDFSAAP